jgi:hypothetical protein
MTTRLEKALQSKTAQHLLAAGLTFTSTGRQVDNGTLALAGIVNGHKVKYVITSAGVVRSNNFRVRIVQGDYPLDTYRRGLKTAAALLSKRLA